LKVVILLTMTAIHWQSFRLFAPLLGDRWSRNMGICHADGLYKKWINWSMSHLGWRLRDPRNILFVTWGSQYSLLTGEGSTQPLPNYCSQLLSIVSHYIGLTRLYNKVITGNIWRVMFVMFQRLHRVPEQRRSHLLYNWRWPFQANRLVICDCCRCHDSMIFVSAVLSQRSLLRCYRTT